MHFSEKVRRAGRGPLTALAACAAMLGLGTVSGGCKPDEPEETAVGGMVGAGGSGNGGAQQGGTSAFGGASAGDSSNGGALPTTYCSLSSPVQGAIPAPGFCARNFARVATPRTLLVAPNGDLFIGAPSASTPGGAPFGDGAIFVASDDNKDGVAELSTFLSDVSEVHGIALGGGYLYFTTRTSIFRTPYVNGQRKETGPREDLKMPKDFAGARWTHGLALSKGGRLLTTRGQYGTCGGTPGGAISLASMESLTDTALGMRNPLYVRCHYKDEVCAANELGEDQTMGAREKFILLRPDTNFGYPCCFGSKQPISSDGPSECDNVDPEDASFPLSNTPFGFDWEHDLWPEPYRGGVFVALHGSFYSSPRWEGVGVVYAPVDPKTRAPKNSEWRTFLDGFGPEGGPMERPSDIVFGEDGRMFISDDQAGLIYWVAPETLMVRR